jgi:Asp-tRNA(Asn)/Glu-tRNA(Gln) amidotransferase A subunit family amidase
MPRPPHPEPDELAQLIADRDRYREWLQNLADQKDEIPEAVFSRVQLDYRARLKDVYRQLRTRLDGVRALHAERLTELRDTRSHLQERQDELAEAELRHRVGEYERDRWQQIQRTLSSQIEAAEQARAELQEAVDRLEETLVEIGRISEEVDQFDDAAFVRSLMEGAAQEKDDDEGEDEEKEDQEEEEAPAEPEVEEDPQDEVRQDPPERAREPAVRAPRPAVEAPTHPAMPPPPPPIGEPKPRRTVECRTCGMFNVSGARFCEYCGGAL